MAISKNILRRQRRDIVGSSSKHETPITNVVSWLDQLYGIYKNRALTQQLTTNHVDLPIRSLIWLFDDAAMHP